MRTATVPTLSWPDFLDRFDWRQGEHLTVIGTTGSGKSTLIGELLANAQRTHPWRVLFRTKPRDKTLDALEREGYVRLADWTVADADITPRVVLAPPLKRGTDSIDQQRAAFREALISIYRQGGWLVDLDEIKHLTNFLHLEADVELLYHQGRSNGISVVAGAQRPRHIPLVAYDQAAHLFFFQTPDKQMRDRLGELTGLADPVQVRDAVEGLPFHAVVYVNPRTGDIARTQVEL